MNTVCNEFYDIKGVVEGCRVCIMFNALPVELSDIKEYDALELKQHVLVLGGRHVATPRLQTAFGDKGTYYSFSGATAKAKEWTPFLTLVKEYVEKITNNSFNFVLINKYRDGNDTIGWHSDSEKELRGPIVSITIGCVRDFVLKNNKTKETITIPLPHNSCLMFDESTNKNYIHSVPRRKKCKDVRYNLTFRTISN
jgi:alkylated DNA repair dioxygenase AlkB